MSELSNEEIKEVGGAFDTGAGVTAALVVAPLGPEASLLAFVVVGFLSH